MIGVEGLNALHRSMVAILGAGNIGGEAARHLAMLGVGVLLVDRDTVRAENLGAQGFTEDDLGLAKVEARARHLASLNPDCRIEALKADIESLGLCALGEVDLILCCLDSRRARAVVNELATRLGIPWVDAAIDGSGRSLFGRVAAYDPTSSGGACYLCAHDRKSLGEILREGREERCPVWRWDEKEVVSTPTLAISALGAAVAAVQVFSGLKTLLGRGTDVSGREMYVDLERGVSSLHSLARNPHCLFDHRVLALTPFGRGASEATVRETFAAAEKRLGREVRLNLHRRSVVTEIRCPECGVAQHPHRVFEAMRIEEATCECGATMRPAPAGLLSRFGREEAAEFLDRSWAQMGLPPRDVVTASNSKAEVHFVLAERWRER
jgi:molybdopterin/thiamine biosynthesis adenylyltransferase